MTNFPFLTGFFKRAVCTVFAEHFVEIVGFNVVDLIQIDVVGLQLAEADIDFFFHALAVAHHALRGQDKAIPASFECGSEVFFRNGIAARRIDEVHADFVELVHDDSGLVGRTALDGNPPKGNCRYL